ncbi:hypothetical protein PSEUDO8AS_40204 [Pseudomonas sp. 8AS]|nr:hypothetical protein PSEUDO8AS_40204 [Pseudomonas sp. 8AS]
MTPKHLDASAVKNRAARAAEPQSLFKASRARVRQGATLVTACDWSKRRGSRVYEM